MSDHRQRQRHGVTKALVEGAGGLIVGSALVLLLRQLLRPRPAVASGRAHRESTVRRESVAVRSADDA